jgi:CRISPR-associated protein Cmr4
MITHIYTIRALTNLHVGSGDAGYGVVDKLVQRDAATKYPTINMSGVKGALRQHFEDNRFEADITEIFGSAPNAGEEKISQGKVRFISAELLALPLPVTTGDKAPYELVHDEVQLERWRKKANYFEKGAGTRVQSADVGRGMSPKQFSPIAEDMPVVARNYLDDGQSKNLWYEEFVPRESIFAVILQARTPQKGENPLLKIQRVLEAHPVVQLGGNATVGYGYCLFTLQPAKS